MDFGLIALCLTVAHIILTYVAPKTKTTADDKARDVIGTVKSALPAANAAKPSMAAKPVEGFGMARDHRK